MTNIEATNSPRISKSPKTQPARLTKHEQYRALYVPRHFPARLLGPPDHSTDRCHVSWSPRDCVHRLCVIVEVSGLLDRERLPEGDPSRRAPQRREEHVAHGAEPTGAGGVAKEGTSLQRRGGRGKRAPSKSFNYWGVAKEMGRTAEWWAETGGELFLLPEGAAQ